MSVTLHTTPQLSVVRGLPTGDHVQGFYLLTKLETRPKKNGELFLTCELRDSSGRIDGKMWEDFQSVLTSLAAGDAVFADGRMDHYREQPGLILTSLRKATEQEVPDRRSFLPHSALSATAANERLAELLESVKQAELRALLELVFDDVTLRKRFLEAPGGKQWHHSTLGGLAEHTLSMCRLAEAVCENYPQLQRDLLLTGTLLHDIGKIFELSTDVAIDYTVEGRLLGHIPQGVLFVERQLERIENFPAELRRQLLHMILSHQGDETMGSPVKPMTLEALALHYLDQLDSRVNAFEQVRAKSPEGAEFSDYVKLMDRFFYLRPADSGDDEEQA